MYQRVRENIVTKERVIKGGAGHGGGKEKQKTQASECRTRGKRVATMSRAKFAKNHQPSGIDGVTGACRSF